MSKTTHKHLSTTALARQLGKESKELFILLANSGWILKVDGRWQLTEKGKFEGGIYVHHPKFGDYIAWPESVAGHPLLALLPEAPLTASNLSQKLGLPPRLMNGLLAERGWLKKALRGWHLTPAGAMLGGQQQTSEQSGIPFVTWPETLMAEPALRRAVDQLHGVDNPDHPGTLDGHGANNRAQRMIDNWLYVAGVVHARDYVLVLDGASATQGPPLVADFYLPGAGLCIEYWGDEASAAALGSKLEKQEAYRLANQAFIELQDPDLDHLDEILARELLRHGLAVY